MRRIILLIASLFVSLTLQAQTRIAGTVTDAAGPVPGASIVVEGTTPPVGASTDLEGRFSLTVPKGKEAVVVMCLGYEDRRVVLTGRSDLGQLHIVLHEAEAEDLDEAVVTGYAQTTTKRITGSVSVIKSDVFLAKPTSSVDALMAGEVAGVSVRATSGQPGTQSKIRIRGTNNLSGNSEPLWVVDGVPVQNESNLSSDEIAAGGLDNIFVNGIGNINPNDIESVTILKDAAAAAIYGSKAANGVIVISTKSGSQGRMHVGYSNNFTWSFRPQRSVGLMNSAEKLAWEQELWDEFSAGRFAAAKEDPTLVYPVVGIVGQIRAGAGPFAGMDTASQDAFIASLASQSTDWYGQLFRNAFSHNHHLSLSGGEGRMTYYVSLGMNDDNGMLIHNRYQRYNLNSRLTLRPVDMMKLDIGIEGSRQSSRNPDSSVNAFTYAYFANPYEKPYNEDGSYAADNTWFTLGYYNGRGQEQVMPASGFSILRELDLNSTRTVNTAASVRAQMDLYLTPSLTFTGLASWSLSENDTDKIVDKSTYTAFRDRLGNDDRSQNNLYGSITQNRTGRNSYILRGHLNWNRTFAERHTFNVIGGVEIRGSKSNTLFSKRYHYNPVTGTTALPAISGPQDQWVRQVERLNGEYFSDTRYASFYLSGDYYLGKTLVTNASFRTDGSSSFGVNQQFHPTWSAGAGWHFGQEDFIRDHLSWLNHGTLRAAYGFTGNINSYAKHLLVMEYILQQYRYYGSDSYMLGRFPSAPNPDLGWEKTSDLKIGLDLGFLKDRFTVNTEWYHRMSTDVVTSSQVQSTTGFTSVYFNSADILNTGVETTLTWSEQLSKDFHLRASVNFAYNFNKVTRYTPSYGSTITSKDRYVEGYPVGAIFAGDLGGVDSANGLYSFRLRDDADILSAQDLNNPDNYRRFLGTTVAPYTGGVNLTFTWRAFRLSASGVYSFGGKVYDRIISPASYLNARHEGVSTEEVQSQFSDLYANHLNVTRDRTDRWTEASGSGLYPRIYDRFDARYNFAYYNPMDSNIIDAIYLKDVSYLRIKSLIFTYSFPRRWLDRIHTENLSINLSLNNFFTFTSYDGMDPEVPGATYPTTRSVSLGAYVNF